MAKKHDDLMVEELTGSTRKEEIKNRLAAAEFDAKIIAGHKQDGSHPNLMEI